MSQQANSLYPFNCSTYQWDDVKKTLVILRVNSHERLKIEGDDSLDIFRFLNHSDGINSIEQIAKNCSFETEKGLLIYHFLVDERVIYESSTIWQWFLSTSQNPSQFAKALTDDEIVEVMESTNFIFGPRAEVSETRSINSSLTQLLLQRSSCRNFDEKHSLCNTSLFELLQVMSKSEDHWTVPSAGGLYSFIPVIILLRPTETLSAGVYFYNPLRQSLHQPTEASNYHDQLWFERMLGSSSYSPDPSLIILLAANVERVSRKNSNRALRFCFIEAGHMAQNLMIYSAEKNLGCLEYGGFDDEIAQLIVGESSIIPLTCLIVGKEDDANSPKEESLYQALHNSGVIQRSVKQHNSTFPRYLSPFIKVATSIDGEESFGFGAGTSFEEAALKSAVEVLERSVSTQAWYDVTSSADDLDGLAIYPHEIYGYHESVYRSKPIKRLSSSEPIKWVQATEYLSRKRVYVPMENIFYGYEDPKFGFNSSNGVAAHETQEKAFLAGFLELIERDAFVARFHAQKAESQVPYSFWPSWMQKQANQLLKEGFETSVINLTLDGPIVLLVCIWSTEQLPFFVTGSSASFDYEIACKKAFQEAEFMLTSWGNKKTVKVDPKQVETPHDHGSLYLSAEALSRVDWLLTTPQGLGQPVSARKLDELIEKFNPCYVDLTSRVELPYPLSVVRTISTELFPMYFGFGFEPYNHKRRENLDLTWVTKYPSYPHFFD